MPAAHPSKAVSPERSTVPALGRWTWFFLTVAACPVVFVFAMMQMSAITVPFWDHWEQAQFIITYYDKGLWAAVHETIVTLSQHSRPVTDRLIFLFNAALTKWDIRSEYVYLYAALAGGLLIHYRIIRKLAGTSYLTAREAALFSTISILYFSPANHNNHWWSMMLQLDLNNVYTLAILGLLLIGTSWWRSIGAAILCWLSVYTLTNGLFLIVVAAAISQIASGAPWRITKRTLFWLANIILVYWAYFPIAEPGMTARPALSSVFLFALAYFGNPVRELLQFSYENQFEPAPGMVLSVTCGAILLIVYGLLVFFGRQHFRKPSPAFLILLGFGCFAIVSALATGWARVTFDQYGIRNGNSSRYVITGNYLLFSILYFCFAEGQHVYRWFRLEKLSSRIRGSVAIGAYVLLLAFAGRSYARSIKIYETTRDFDALIGRGFQPDASKTNVDQYLYPNQDRLKLLRKDLLRLRIGPYRRMAVMPNPNDAIQTLSRNKLLDQFGVNGLREETFGRILFAHPHSQFMLPITAPIRSVSFRFGILDQAPTPGITIFSILFRSTDGQPQQIWSMPLDPTHKAADRGTHSARVDVTGPGELIFETKAPGITENLWAYWIDVSIQ